MRRAAQRSSSSWLRIAAVLTLLGLALMVWAIVDPRATPVMIAMSVGQGLGTLAFAIYLGVVLADLRRARVFADDEPGEEPGEEPDEEPDEEPGEGPAGAPGEGPAGAPGKEPGA